MMLHGQDEAQGGHAHGLEAIFSTQSLSGGQLLGDPTEPGIYWVWEIPSPAASPRYWFWTRGRVNRETGFQKLTGITRQPR